MSKYKVVVVGTDGSDTSLRAGAYVLLDRAPVHEAGPLTGFPWE